jgi:dihydrodipicolinate synthase/N-acetylneuraminate lyase
VTAPAGVTAALLTPLDDRGQTDHDGLSALVKAVLAGGVTGISPLGSTGEGYSMSLAQRLEVIEAVAAAAGPGVPVTPGVFAANPELALAEIDAYAGRGATAALLAPPSYYPLSPAEQEAYFAQVAGESPLPLVLYNIPVFTKVSIAPPVVAELAARPQVIGIKDSSRDFGYFQSVLDRLAVAGVPGTEFAVLTGTDTMLISCLLAGGRGTICASANVVPRLPAGIYAAVRSGALDQARILERQLRQVLDVCRADPAPAGLKGAIAAAGLAGPALRAPRLGVSADRVAEIGRLLTELGAPWVGAAVRA